MSSLDNLPWDEWGEVSIRLNRDAVEVLLTALNQNRIDAHFDFLPAHRGNEILVECILMDQIETLRYKASVSQN